MKRAHLVVGLTLVAFSSCTCGPPKPTPSETPVGQVVASVIDGGFDIRLQALERPVRSLQVDVKLQGTRATRAESIAGADLLETSLGVPSDAFTVVVGDTRRLNLPSGAVVRVFTEAPPTSITLSGALAVDDAGALRTFTEVLP